MSSCGTGRLRRRPAGRLSVVIEPTTVHLPTRWDARQQPPPTAYWCAGPVQLPVGEYVLPPSLTGRPALWGTREDRVYLFEARELAWAVALLSGSGLAGWLYQVEPYGVPQVDPASTWACRSWLALGARIVTAEPCPSPTSFRLPAGWYERVWGVCFKHGKERIPACSSCQLAGGAP